jgi:hypothetical protein
MSRMGAWQVVLLILVGCGKGEMPQESAINGTPIPGCSMDREPTLEQLRAVYNRWPHDTVDDAYGEASAMSLSELDGGVIDLQSRPCCDFPLRHLGYQLARRIDLIAVAREVRGNVVVAGGPVEATRDAAADVGLRVRAPHPNDNHHHQRTSHRYSPP